MTDSFLLNLMCNYLEEERVNKLNALSGLEKNLKLVPNDFKISESIKEIKSDLRLISKDSIKKYHTFWSALGDHDRRPCPSCFCRQGRISNLVSLNESHGFEWLKCEDCKIEFPVPID